MNQYLAELIGTFWLVLGGCGSAVLAAAFPNVGIGLLGLPVFTQGGGIGYVLQPSFGFLLGLIPAAAVVDGKAKRLPAALRRGAKNHLWSQVHKAFSVVTAEDIAGFQREMNAAKVGWEFTNYSGAVHCFAEADANSPPGCVYHPRAAKRAYRMLEDFFEERFGD